MGVARLTWHGDRVRDRMIDATELAVDKTMSECVTRAKADHPGYPPASEPYERYANRTAFLEASVAILDEAGLEP